MKLGGIVLDITLVVFHRILDYTGGGFQSTPHFFVNAF